MPLAPDASLYALAKLVLWRKGWTCTQDIDQLAERLDDTIDDFIADLENGPLDKAEDQYDREQDR